MTKFKITNKNNHVADVYIRRDGYSRKVPPFGYISLGELSSDEIATYKKYSVVGLVLEIDSDVVKPVTGVKGAVKKEPPVEEKPLLSKPEPKPEPKPEVKIESKPEPKVESVPAPVPVQEVKHESHVEVHASAEEEKESLDGLTSAELKAKAAEVGMSIDGIKKKTELREALKRFLGLAD